MGAHRKPRHPAVRALPYAPCVPMSAIPPGWHWQPVRSTLPPHAMYPAPPPMQTTPPQALPQATLPPPAPPRHITLRERMEESALMPEAAKQFARSLRPGDAKAELWCERALRLPLGRFSSACGASEVGDVLRRACKGMDAAVHGNAAAKHEVVRILGQIATNGNAGTAIALEGPPGVGKTTFARTALAQALDRPFCSISLGGSSDGSSLNGHVYTYEGSMPGRVAQELMRVGRMDPIFYFDELDKVSDSARGDEIVNMLLHLIDASQNTDIADRYFHAIPLDLSRAVFVFSFNDRRKVNPVLLDRLKVVACPEPSRDEKRVILREHLWPRALRSVGDDALAVLHEEAVEELLDATAHEKGVRDLGRAAQHVAQSLNVIVHAGGEVLGIDVRVPDARPVQCTRTLCRELLPSPPASHAAAPPPNMYS